LFNHTSDIRGANSSNNITRIRLTINIKISSTSSGDIGTGRIDGIPGMSPSSSLSSFDIRISKGTGSAHRKTRSRGITGDIRRIGIRNESVRAGRRDIVSRVQREIKICIDRIRITAKHHRVAA